MIRLEPTSHTGTLLVHLDGVAIGRVVQRRINWGWTPMGLGWLPRGSFPTEYLAAKALASRYAMEHRRASVRLAMMQRRTA